MLPRLRLLGSPKLESHGTVSDLPIDRPVSLAFYLLLRGDWVRRSELVYLYYPDTEEALAQSNFRKLVHRLKLHPWAATLEAEATRLRLVLPTDWAEFRCAVAEKDFAQALRLHHGTLLEGVQFPELVGFEAWLELERQDLAWAWRMAVLEQVKTLAAAEQYDQAEACLLPVLRLDPLDEAVLQAHLRLLNQAGNTARAAAVFEDFQLELARELGAKPLPETFALAQHGFGLLRQSSLPAASTRLVGRQTELADLQKLLRQSDERLITLLGLGGTGKTRLALELARQMTEHYPDGVWFVSLVGVATPEQLLPSLGAVLGIGSADVLEFLYQKTMLVVFDNFEHLLDGASKLEELLVSAAGLQVLVTSRSALNLRFERLIDVVGLAYPQTLPTSHVERFEAVTLLLEMAERADRQLERSPENLQAAAQISRKVQGLPLALELAATWVRGLGLPEIAQKLEQNLELLASPYPTIPAQHPRCVCLFVAASVAARATGLERLGDF
jgi:DNA-binding SARP family transcriptional activator